MIYKPKNIDDNFADYAVQVIATTGEIYSRHTLPVMKMLTKRIIRGTFEKDLAIKGIVSGIIEPSLPKIKQEYNAYYDDGSYHVNKVSAETKEIIAEALLEEYEELIRDMVNDAKKSKRVVKKKIVKKTRKV